VSITHVTVKEAHRLHAEEGYTYVDVRSIPEFEQGHPAGAHNVPLLHFDPGLGRMTLNPEFLAVMQGNYPRDARLLIGCQVGGRSVQAAQLLASAGYQCVANVLGGYGGARHPITGKVLNEGWVQAGLPTETAPQQGCTYEELRAHR